jgi:hypothetical protein
VLFFLFRAGEEKGFNPFILGALHAMRVKVGHVELRTQTADEIGEQRGRAE